MGIVGYRGFSLWLRDIITGGGEMDIWTTQILRMKGKKSGMVP